MFLVSFHAIYLIIHYKVQLWWLSCVWKWMSYVHYYELMHDLCYIRNIKTGLSNAFVQCWQIHSSIPIGCMLFGSERENLLFWISRPLLSVVGMPCVNSPLSVRVQRPSRLLMNHLMQFSTFLSPHLIDGKLQPNVLHGYSLLQCTSEYILRALLLFLWRRGRLMSLEVILNTLRSVCWSRYLMLIMYSAV